MDYSGLSVIGIKAIQELQEKIVPLRQLVITLETRLAKIRGQKNNYQLSIPENSTAIIFREAHILYAIFS